MALASIVGTPLTCLVSVVRKVALPKDTKAVLPLAITVKVVHLKASRAHLSKPVLAPHSVRTRMRLV